ncbi:MAG: ribonuclease III [Aeromicrobium sp.]|nr:ribonuclease III [Burkholderiales bacterium]
MATSASSLAERLGYVFQNSGLLVQGLTHRSFGMPHNERLEFLGDAMLNLAIAELIFEKFPVMPEGELSRLRANLVNQTTLASIAEEIALGSSLRLGDGEIKTGGASRPSMLADAVESLIGAVLVDGGFFAARELVTRLFATRLDAPEQNHPSKDAKTALQEWLQGRRHQLPQYMVKRIEGAAHQQTFYVECITERPAFKVEGTGVTRRAAEQDAAAKILAKIELKGIA